MEIREMTQTRRILIPSITWTFKDNCGETLASGSGATLADLHTAALKAAATGINVNLEIHGSYKIAKMD